MAHYHLRTGISSRGFAAAWCSSNPHQCLNQSAMTRALLYAVRQHTSNWALQATAVDHLIMNVDGFNATQAVAVHPPLAEMDMQQFALCNLGVIQSLVPARIQGQLFTHHPRLLEVDMQVRRSSSGAAGACACGTRPLRSHLIYGCTCLLCPHACHSFSALLADSSWLHVCAAGLGGLPAVVWADGAAAC